MISVDVLEKVVLVRVGVGESVLEESISEEVVAAAEASTVSVSSIKAFVAVVAVAIKFEETYIATRSSSLQVLSPQGSDLQHPENCWLGPSQK